MSRFAFVLVAVVGTAGVATAQPKPGSTAPSTGHEMPKGPAELPAEAQVKIAREGLKAGDCRGHVGMFSTAISVGGSKLTPEERITANVMLQKCARAEKAWQAVLQASTNLLELAPDKANPQDIIQAYLGLDDEKHAIEMLKTLAKKYPAQLPQLTAAKSLIVCKRNDFKACNAASGKMIDVLKKDKTPPFEAVLENTMFHAVSAAALGDYKTYEADWKSIDEVAKQNKFDTTKLAPLKTKIEQARTAQLFIDWNQANQLALGTYHYMTGGKLKDAGNLFDIRMINQAKKQRDIKVTVEVIGVTEPMTVTLSLPPGVQVNKSLSPPLKLDFDVSKLRAPRDSQLAVHVVDAKTNASIIDQSFKIAVLPHDHLPLQRNLGSDAAVTTLENSLAWVTPNAKEVDAFLGKAKARVEDPQVPHSFTGPQYATIPQAKAIFDELKSHGVTYVMDPNVFDPHGAVQRTRLPAEVLASTNAQCLEGAILYATLFEAAGLSPVIVFIPGHAFIAWKPSPKDKTKAPLLFLETTMTGNSTFEQAVEHATLQYADEVKAKHFDLGSAALIDVRALRAKGYTAQPY